MENRRSGYLQRLNYKVISLGTNCIPRVVSTLARRKPRKKYGELTTPFDVAFHFDVPKNMELVQNGFENYFDGLVRGEWENKETWINPSINSVYNHESVLSKEEFVEKYKKRIENFYTYASSNGSVFFILDFFSVESEDTIEKLFKTLLCLKNRNLSNTFLVVFNHSAEHISLCGFKENILNLHTPCYLNNFENWAKYFKDRSDQDFNNFQDSMSAPLKKFIATHCKG